MIRLVRIEAVIDVKIMEEEPLTRKPQTVYLAKVSKAGIA